MFLVVTTAELALVAGLGSWTRWLIIHGVIAVLVMLVMLVRLGQARRRGTDTGAETGRRRGIAGLLNGRGRGTGSGDGGGAGAGRRGLAGLLGGRSHGTTSGRSTGAGISHKRGLAGPLGGRNHGTHTGTGNRPGTKGRSLGGLLGGRSHGTTPKVAGTRHAGRGGSNAGLPGRSGSGSSNHGRHIGTGKAGYRARNPLKDLKEGWDKAGPRPKDPNTDPDKTDPDDGKTTPKGKPTEERKGPKGKPTEQDEPREDDRDEAPRIPIEPERPIQTETEGDNGKMVKTQGSPSLQAWGRCLPTVAAALLEKQQQFRKLEGELGELVQAVARLRGQGEEELPASPKLVGLLSDVEASLSRLPAVSELLRNVAGYAEALPSIYRSEHAGDEDRLHGVRGGREREKRSDVSAAEQDT